MKFSKQILIICCLFFSISAYSQSLPDKVTKLSILPLGLEFESRMGDRGKYHTSVFAFGLNYGIQFSTTTGMNYALGGSAMWEPRFYNIAKRRERNKRIDNYSGFYFALPITAFIWSGSLGSNAGFSAGPKVGFQYAFGKKRRGFFNVAGGFGLVLSREGTGLAPLGSSSIGFILNKK